MRSSPSPANAGPSQSDGAARARGSWTASVALVGFSILFALAVCEAGFRLAAGVPLFKFANWREERVAADRLREFKAVPDAVLGWVPRPFSYHRDGYTSIAYGLRQNFGEKDIRTGSVLAVGDSFTEGWEVKDNESWPALLEKRTGKPVVNGGVGAYGTDQIVLRAEQLLPIVKPKILIVGFLEEDIFRAEHSVFGAPKPYFTLENGELVYHPPPPYEPPRQGTAFASFMFGLRDVFGYSAAAHYIFARLAPRYWYGRGARGEYRKAGIDPVAVTCALLRRLKARTDRNGIRMILFMQYHAPLIIEADERTDNARGVIACAGAAGIRVVDQFDPLHALERATPNALAAYYFAYDGELVGHMTRKGNEHAAGMLEKALRE